MISKRLKIDGVNHRIYSFSMFSRTTILLICIMIATLFVACAGPIMQPSPTLSGHLLVTGSTALQPLASEAANLFQKQHPQAKVEVRGGGSLVGLQAVTSRQVDVGTSDVYADPAIYPDPNLTDHIVCMIPFTMVTGPGVTVTSLTREQIIAIFSTGTISNWQQVGGSNLPIVPVVRPATSGTRATFRKYVLDGRDENGTLLKTDSSTAVRDIVAHTPGAIGYLALSVLDSSVHALAIDSLGPTKENITSGRYTFWSYEHMYTLGDTNDLLASYLDFMLTPTIQELAQKLSYIPIANMQLPTLESIAHMTNSPLPPAPILFESEVTRREFP